LVSFRIEEMQKQNCLEFAPIVTLPSDDWNNKMLFLFNFFVLFIKFGWS
jgi:hypothetical protein